MKVSPISQNQYNSKKPSFNAVNQKYLKLAKENYERYKPYHFLGDILTDLELDTVYGFITYRDAIDTLEAIKPYAQNALECIDDSIEKLKRVIARQSNQ